MGNQEEKMGTMKKIYILHGWAYSTEKWNPFIKELQHRGFEVKLLKIPGLTAPLDEVWKLEDYVKWLKIILDQEKEPVILIGHSNGGRISLAFTYKYHEKVKQLILIDSAGIHRTDLVLKIKRLVFGSLAKAGKVFRYIPVMRKLLYKLVREHDYEKANPILQKTMRNLIKADLSHALQHISVPTTIIWGEKDKITPVKDADKMHEEIENSSLFIIPGAKHSPQFTNVKELVEIIVKEAKE